MEFATAFLRSEILMLFEMFDGRSRMRVGGRGGAPLNLSFCKNSVAIPSRPAAPLQGVRRMTESTLLSVIGVDTMLLEPLRRGSVRGRGSGVAQQACG